MVEWPNSVIKLDENWFVSVVLEEVNSVIKSDVNCFVSEVDLSVGFSKNIT